MEKINYKIIIVFVGLPASGKSYTSLHIKQYLEWIGYKIDIFNCGNYRRKIGNDDSHDASFFDHSNKKNVADREYFLNCTLFDLNTFLVVKKGDVAILDATNSTKKRREKINKFFSLFSYSKKIIFIENITTDLNIINTNINFKQNSPDYKGYTIDEMRADFQKRLSYYKDVYERINDEEELNYIKMFDCGKKVTYNNIFGYIETLLLNFLINFRVCVKKIYITRHGESLYNLESRIGGDPDLTEEGYAYSKKLYNHISLKYKPEDIIIFTSNLKRTKNTAQLFIKNGYQVKHRELLNEIDGGVCENMTYNEVKEKMPEIFEKRKKDKFNFKYPEGESYYDLIIRIKSFILEINRVEKPILIICHNAIVRTIYSYFLSYQHNEIPYIEVPLHKLNCIENNKYFYVKKNIM